MLWNRGKPFALCVVTSPRGSVQSVRWMREFRAFDAVSVEAGCRRYGGCGGWVQSVRWVREVGAVGAVSAWARCSWCGGCVGSMQSVRRVRGLDVVGAVDERE